MEVKKGEKVEGLARYYFKTAEPNRERERRKETECSEESRGDIVLSFNGLNASAGPNDGPAEKFRSYFRARARARRRSARY